jgi:hypothetical protein
MMCGALVGPWKFAGAVEVGEFIFGRCPAPDEFAVDVA